MKRESNIELLRIVSMFLVLVIHVNFLAVEAPTTELAMEKPLSAYTQYFVASLSFICVNVFVLISGWFGIKTKRIGLLRYLFQCLFFSFLVYLTVLLTGRETFSLRGLSTCFFLNENDNWFVKSYLLLYLLAPVLNAFVENVSRRQFLLVLTGFFVFQSLFGWATHGVEFFIGGYSTLSFVGLYLLARYVRLYPPRWATKSWQSDLMAITAIVLLTSITSFVAIRNGVNIVWIKMYQYTNPLIVLESLLLLLFFSKLHFQSRIINWFAASAFATYLLHTNVHLFRTYYVRFAQQIYAEHSGIEYLCLIFLFIAAVFVAATLIDKVRIALWNAIEQRCFTNNK